MASVGSVICASPTAVAPQQRIPQGGDSDDDDDDDDDVDDGDGSGGGGEPFAFVHRTVEVTQTTTVTESLTAIIGAAPRAAPRMAPVGGYQAWGGTAAAAADEGDAARRLTGALGELLVYETFSATLPGFGPDCWRSGSRALAAGLVPPAFEGVVDFVWTDEAGHPGLLGRPGVTYYFEVKSTSTNYGGCPGDSFALSEAQLNLALRLRGAPDAAFVVVRVIDAGGRPGAEPRVAALILDLAERLSEGRLRLRGSDLALEFTG